MSQLEEIRFEIRSAHVAAINAPCHEAREGWMEHMEGWEAVERAFFSKLDLLVGNGKLLNKIIQIEFGR